MLVTFESRAAVLAEIRRVTPTLEEQGLQAIGFALTGDIARYIAIGEHLGDSNMTAAGNAAAASDQLAMLWLVPKLIDEGDWPVLAAVALFYGDTELRKRLTRIMFGKYEVYFDYFPGLLSGETTAIHLPIANSYELHSSDDDVQETLRELEIYYDGRDPFDTGSTYELAGKHRLVILTAALSLFT
jgi:hypothetical protein